MGQRGHDLCFEILKRALATGTLKNPKIASCLTLLTDLAGQGYPQAVLLQGQILEREGKRRETLHFYQEWTEVYAEARQSPPFSESMDAPSLANISKGLARLRFRFGDRAGAEEALREAPLVYDDPVAYHHLAVDFTKPGSEDYNSYLIKAAAAGQVKAAQELGSLYVRISRHGTVLETPNLWNSNGPCKVSDAPSLPGLPTSQPLPQEEILSLRATAMEWYAVAATSGITDSQVCLALLLRAAGRADEGFTWLLSASKSENAEEWAEAIDYFKTIWRHPNAPDPMRMDIDSMRKSSRNRNSKSVPRQLNLDGPSPTRVSESSIQSDLKQFPHLP